jgi:hypothetical protein
MRLSYQGKLALPEDVVISVTWANDADVDDEAVDAYVKSIGRPEWYTHDHSNRKDTRLYMLERHQPFGTAQLQGRTVRTWTCEACGGPVLYEGAHIGHKRRWRDELRAAGVTSASEARAAYNNLNNLRIECSTCNQSHDWE